MKTTVEIPDPLLQRVRALATREGRTLRDLVEEGLSSVLRERTTRVSFVLRDARVGGGGLAPELQGRGWNEIRDAAYEGRGGR
jgi:hypothetical protein